ncbi:hypothetical protein Tdes44962_MAKER07583 [Teratosphaeria destructans]|uniref:Uncharacterized protein n=1 Tax=Teratosphaeria destructans TaxID=418781 RepID=A0A9W7W5N3_9PEZI|nr:hypothetical protein Tdes44962_MAKER07583 [Teratosphaeria destructans]
MEGTDRPTGNDSVASDTFVAVEDAGVLGQAYQSMLGGSVRRAYRIGQSIASRTNAMRAYDLPATKPRTPATEHMLTIAPFTPCLRKELTASLETIAGAVTFVAITRSHVTRSTSPIGSNLSMMAALLMTMSMWPNIPSPSAKL